MVDGNKEDITKELQRVINDFRGRVEEVDSFHRLTMEGLHGNVENMKRLIVESITKKENELKEQVEEQVASM